MRLELKIINKEFYKKYPLPRYATIDSAGLDLRTTQSIALRPGQCTTVSTGLAIHIGSGEGRGFLGAQNIMGLIVPRSSLGMRGLSLQNTVGIDDADYQGELLIAAYNHHLNDVLEVEAGERIAQLILMPILKADFNIVEEFSKSTERGTDGFGSTNKF